MRLPPATKPSPASVAGERSGSWRWALAIGGDIRASPTVCHSAFPSLIFWQNEKKPSPIVWHPPSPSFTTSQKSIPRAHICARPRSAHPEFPDPSSKKEERQGSRWEKRNSERSYGRA
jgi:hypothetical protein